MRADVRQRYRKAQEVAFCALELLPAAKRSCYFCGQDFYKYLQTRGHEKWDITLHHVNEDRTPKCAKVWPCCPHVKNLAHESCHRSHHLRDRWATAKGKGSKWLPTKPKRKAA